MGLTPSVALRGMPAAEHREAGGVRPETVLGQRDMCGHGCSKDAGAQPAFAAMVSGRKTLARPAPQFPLL